MRFLSRFIFILVCLIALVGIITHFVWRDISFSPNDHLTSVSDFNRIKEKGELTILTLNSSTSYFIYREEPMGFHYDLAKAFCEEHQLELKVKVGKNTEHLVQMLKKGEGDLVATSLLVQNDLKNMLIYCGINQISYQVLVQKMDKTTPIKDVTELIGKKITVRKNSKFHQRLKNLNAEIGSGIEIDTNVKDTTTSEDLIEMVSKGQIMYTVTDEYIAKLNKTYFINININLPVSFDQRLSWAVSKSAPQLAQALDEWYANNETNTNYKSISKKYFELSKQTFSGEFELPKNLPPGHISPYDDLFKKHAQGTRFHWQLLAAIAYQESRFRNGLTSWAGASGIMGLMPNIAKHYGISLDQRMNPDLSIGVSIQLLQALDKMLSNIEEEEERMKFILAAYNGGIGHVTDVRALAKKYGANSQLWEGNVRNWITQKRHPKYYNDPVVKNGYFRGTETLNYVDNVSRISERFRKETSR